MQRIMTLLFISCTAVASCSLTPKEERYFKFKKERRDKEYQDRCDLLKKIENNQKRAAQNRLNKIKK